MNAIEIRNLTKKYDEFTLNDISFNVPKGTIVGLVGENGAGKSTTIKLIMNRINKDSGTINVLGNSNKDKDFYIVKNDIGVVLDESCFPEMLTAKEVGKIMSLTYNKWDNKVYIEKLKKLNINLDKKIKEYSRGMKMKLSIAVALSHNAKLLVLDEATSGLDPMIRNEILDMFNEFTRSEENSILLSSHIVSDLEKICDYIVFIHKGNLILNEEKDEILNKYGIIKTTKEKIEEIPKDAILYIKEENYSYSVLVKKEEVSKIFKFENSTLEDIIILLSKEGK